MVKSVHQNKSKGFTIVELLVVIVVIGILAVVTIIGYTGVTQRAAAAALESDLKNASTALELYKAENGEYPTDADDLPKSGDTVYQYTVENDVFFLSATSPSAGTTAYYITSTSGSILAGVWENHTPPGPLVWKQIAVGTQSAHTCAIATNNNAYCWGWNGSGQLGDSTNVNKKVPTLVSTSGVLSGKTIKYITGGGDFTCALASDNNVYCWGENSMGQLGNNSTTDSLVPVQIDMSGALSGMTILAVDSGYSHSCVIASDNNAYCWGQGTSGQLGHALSTDSLVPVAVSKTGLFSDKTIKSVSAGTSSTCAIASNNNAYCWGAGGWGQLGNNAVANSNVPVAVYTSGVFSGKTVLSIKVGRFNACAIASDNLAYCWGADNYSQIGDSSTTNKRVPTAVSTAGVLSGKTISSISTGDYHSCAVASDSQIYCWGFNDYSSLGTGGTAQAWVPVSINISGVLSGKTIKSVDEGYLHGCAIASDNQIYCWGYNAFGQLGNNSTTDSMVPVMTTPLE